MADERFSLKLASDVAFYLDEAKVPNLLFGWLAMSLVGSRKVSTEVDFVIPDNKMPAAIKTLAETANYPVCKDPNCNELHFDRVRGYTADQSLVLSPNRIHSVAAAHFHLEDGTFILNLHPQSKLLWWLPELTTAAPAAEDPYLMLSTDPRLPPLSVKPALEGVAPTGGPGPCSANLYHPVKILNPGSLTEALLTLLCRDRARQAMGESEEADHLAMLWTLMSSQLYDSCGTSISKHVRPKFKEAWDGLNERDPGMTNVFNAVRALRDRMALANELGPLVDGSKYTPPDDFL
ncbi:uncharacterized protein DSM5745_09476 [Aspergillus mulundensis]|uniref:Uncharacterized protein n=1 Tax=Aspergillus mulundensis TaxID=1810919 RepID=A0A3D8QVD3_9EURO|nr:hypothetical protein DSM5745_09476 [Aspergillus mulundensis]RDW65737.1 hypothetical protein DSM5745_09476 [Aspergillus mulundensis]